MRDFHAIQMTGSPCQGRNCACATTAMDIYFGTRGAGEMTADQVRQQTHTSCIPGVDTPSGGINIPDIEDVCKAHGVTIDFGRAATTFYRRWTTTELRARLGSYYSGHVLGQYSAIKAPWRAHGSTFMGGHSGGAHDYRVDMPDSHYDKVQPTVCWHDPLRPRPIRIPFSVLVAYNQAAGTTKQFVGWVKIPAIPGGTYAKPMLDRTRTAYPTVAVHNARTTGKGSTTRIIKPKGKLVQLAMYAEGARYKGSTTWGALSLLGTEWIHVKRLDHVKGST